MTETPWGGRVVFHAQTASTMDDAQSLEDEGVPEGSLVWAEFQTAGRGRHAGRVWHGAAGDSLMLTAWWAPGRFRVPLFAPSLTVGLGVCLWLESLHLPADLPVSLKWPNDVYLADRKVAGILVRRRWDSSGPRSIHAGIGINLASPAPSQEFRTPAVSLSDAGLTVTPEQGLAALLPWLAAALDHPDPRTAAEQRLWQKDSEIELSAANGTSSPRRGIARGLDESGRLLWDTAEGREAVSSGE